MSDISISITDGVATVALSRPEKLNVIRSQTLQELLDAFADLSSDKTIWAAILPARGKAFCVGVDLTDLMMGSELLVVETGEVPRNSAPHE